jgi:hypothetical protein
MRAIEQMFKTAVAANYGRVGEDETESSSPGAKKARASSDPVPGGTMAVGPTPRKKQLKGEPQLIKKVLLDGDMTRSVKIGAKLSPK